MPSKSIKITIRVTPARRSESQEVKATGILGDLNVGTYSLELSNQTLTSTSTAEQYVKGVLTNVLANMA